jgi:hypothetical protein
VADIGRWPSRRAAALAMAVQLGPQSLGWRHNPLPGHGLQDWTCEIRYGGGRLDKPGREIGQRGIAHKVASPRGHKWAFSKSLAETNRRRVNLRVAAAKRADNDLRQNAAVEVINAGQERHIKEILHVAAEFAEENYALRFSACCFTVGGHPMGRPVDPALPGRPQELAPE